MRTGRTGRRRQRRGQHYLNTGPQTKSNTCGDLRKWMVAQSSKKDLAQTFRLEPFDFPGTGRGLKTKEKISPGTVIVSIPQRLLVTPKSVLDSHLGPLIKSWTTKFTPHQLLALFLVVEWSRGSDSSWHPYVSSMPLEYSLPHYFSAEELNLLPVHVCLKAQQMIQRSRHAHKQVLKLCASHWKNADTWASWEDFRWAWCAVSSRAVYLEAEIGTEELLDLSDREENSMALCPYLDLCNHSTAARVRAGMNHDRGCYEITTEDMYKPHDQVFISYGVHDNIALFLHYGFTLPENTNNKISCSVDDFDIFRETFQMICWKQKLAALHKHELLRGLNISMEGMSWNLQSALKILAMNWDQLQHSERAVTGETLPRDVETTAKRMALHLVTHFLSKSRNLLAKFPKTDGLSLHSTIAQSLVSDEINILSTVHRDLG